VKSSLCAQQLPLVVTNRDTERTNSR